MNAEISNSEKYYAAASLIEGYTDTRPTAQTISRLCKTGRLKARKVLGQWMCRKQDFYDYLESETTLAIEAPKRAATVQPKQRSESKRQSSIAAANASLEKDGVK